MSTNQRFSPGQLVATINGPRHRLALGIFMFVVLAHWAEHVVQALQIWGLGWPRAEALGVLGVPFPWLVSSESLHYGYALVMLVGLWILRHGFAGRSKKWWLASFWIQAWHHLEHFILLAQAVVGANLLGRAVPVSIVQLIVPRVELHLLYNAAVFVPMVIAMVVHLRPNRAEYQQMSCSCRPAPVVAGAVVS